MTSYSAPTFIQSRADGAIYEYKFINSANGKYVYANADGSATRILSADDIAEGFHDVTELETRLRAELFNDVMPYVLRSNRDGTLYTRVRTTMYADPDGWCIQITADDIERGRFVQPNCEWFLRCIWLATDVRAHPFIGAVPCCARHKVD